MHDTAAIFLGQRERNKRDKLLRIKAAARELFISKGYDDTTTREIALRADVGMGTVFTYADNKRDLLFLIANEDLEQTISKANAELSAEKTLMDNLLAVFRKHYEYFQQQPALSRLMLREMLFYDSGQQADCFKTTRDKVIAMICRAVEFAIDAKTVKTKEPARAIGWMLFCIYQVELRQWISENDIRLEDGLARLSKTLQIAILGIGAATDALETRQRRPGRSTQTRRAQ